MCGTYYYFSLGSPLLKPLELFERAELEKAIELQSSVVELNPTKYDEITFLAELLAFAGEWDLIDVYLPRLPVTVDYQALVLSWREIITAETTRHDPHKGATFFVTSPSLEKRLEATKIEDEFEVMDLIEQADSQSAFLSGFIDGRPFEGWRESDDFLSSVLEFFYAGTYYWVPFEEVKKIRFDPASSIRDTLYRPTQIWLSHQAEPLKGFVPLNYLGTSRSPDSVLQTGQETDWTDCLGFAKGVGTRVWMLGEEEICVNEITQIEVKNVEPPVTEEEEEWDEE